MFGKNMFDNLEEKQNEMQDNLIAITVEAVSNDEAIRVVANGNKEIVDISIDASKIDTTDVEQLEDLILTTVNQALEASAEEGAKLTQDMLKDMLPGGFGGLGNLFGQ